MSTYYYKTNDPTVLAAYELMKTERDALVAESAKIAAHFGGKWVTVNQADRQVFWGLRFDPPKPTDLWTVPDKKQGRIQRPRARPNSSALREASTNLVNEYAGLLPKTVVSFDGVYAAIGTNWGSALFAGIGWAFRADWMYIETGLSPQNLATHLIEITGSEYAAARAEVTA